MESLNLRVLCALLLAATGVAFALHPRKCSPVPPRRLHKALHDTVGMGSGLPKPYSLEWAQQRGMVPGYGGVWPGDPNAKKYRVTVRTKKGDEFVTDVPADRYIFHYFEEVGIDLPIANKARMCRQGCCTICTAKVDEGRITMDAPLGLMKEFREKGYALTCCSLPRSDVVCTLQDEDETYIKQWSENFESGGVEWGGVLLDED